MFNIMYYNVCIIIINHLYKIVFVINRVYFNRLQFELMIRCTRAENKP